MTATFFANPDQSRREPFEVGHVQWLRRPGDGGRENLSSGLWFVSPEDAPEPFDLPVHQDETIHIVSGHLRIEVDGIAHDLTAGSMASFTEGAMTRWTIVEPTVEFFVYS